MPPTQVKALIAARAAQKGVATGEGKAAAEGGISAAEGSGEGSGEGGRARGTVTRWHSDRGFGFICPEGGEVEVFCHFRKSVAWSPTGTPRVINGSH